MSETKELASYVKVHTQLPWRLQKESLTIYAYKEGSSNAIAKILMKGTTTGSPDIDEEEAKANADFIIKACAVHYGLLDALKDLVERIERWEEAVREVVSGFENKGMDLSRAKEIIELVENTDINDWLG